MHIGLLAVGGPIVTQFVEVEVVEVADADMGAPTGSLGRFSIQSLKSLTKTIVRRPRFLACNSPRPIAL
jgi:hypothetical protein